MSRQGHDLKDFEVSLIKAMLSSGEYSAYQDILAYFTRPSRSVNHARISEIVDAMGGEPMHNSARKYADQPVASKKMVKDFLRHWPNIDSETGLHLQDDQLVIKSREAMLLAVQSYNNPSTYFKSEIFIVSAIISWLYFLHYFYNKNAVDIVHRKEDGTPYQVNSRDRLLELSACLKLPECPLDSGTINNLNFLIGIRNEIEHEKTDNIDEAISAKLQQCCLNYNRAISEHLGERLALHHKLSLALQFLSIDPAQQMELSGNDMLSTNVSAYITRFENELSNAEYNDPHYACRLVMFRKNENNKQNADLLCEIVPPNSDIEDRINTVFKDRERPKFLPGTIKSLVNNAGYPNFKVHHHTNLWQEHDAKGPNKGFGVDVASQWYWYQSWVDIVLNMLRLIKNCISNLDLSACPIK